jgi:hypothetical protein
MRKANGRGNARRPGGHRGRAGRRRAPDPPRAGRRRADADQGLAAGAIPEPLSLSALRDLTARMLPRVDLAELLLELDASTGFTSEFTHLAESSTRIQPGDAARATDRPGR